MPERRQDEADSGAIAVRRFTSRLLDLVGAPAEVHGAFLALAEVLYEEFEARLSGDQDKRGKRRRPWPGGVSRDRLVALLQELKPLIDRCEALAIRLGTSWPLPPRHPWSETAIGGVSTFGLTLAEEVGTLGSLAAFPVGAPVAVAVIQVVETYLAASARTNVYRRQELGYTNEVIFQDLHIVITDGTFGRTKALSARNALADISEWAIRRMASSLWRIVAVGVGAAWSGVGTVRLLRRVRGLPLQRVDVATPQRDQAPSREGIAGWLRAWRPGYSQLPPPLPGLPEGGTGEEGSY